jgi:hypothetical protein
VRQTQIEKSLYFFASGKNKILNWFLRCFMGLQES